MTAARAPRAGAALAALAAVALAVLPALPWYAARAGGATVRASGLEGAGELWILPLLALIALALASAVARAQRPAEVPPAAGVGLAALGILGLVWSLRSLLDPPAVLSTPLAPGQPVPAPIALEPAALAAPIVAGALVALGILLARPWAWWPR